MDPRKRIAVMMDLDKIYKRHVATFAGILRYARHADWHLINNDWADRMLPARAGAPTPYDGLIGRITALGASRARRLGLPVVNLWFNAPNRATLPGVFPDFSASGREQAEHLLSRGFLNLGVLSHRDDQGFVLEADAFEQTARAANCRQLLRVDLTTGRKKARMGIGALDMADYAQWKRAVGLIDRWMDEWKLPIGLFIFNITTARLVIERCEERGWRIPEDVAIVSGRNDETTCEASSPSISSIELPFERSGYEAARMLDELIDEKVKLGRSKRRTRARPTDPRVILLPPVGVVARQSTDFHAVDDGLVRKALGYIDLNLHRPIAIDDIAKYVGVSRATIVNRFRQHLGRSINKELQRLRIERVKRELAGSDAPIYEIAPKAGFSSVRNLNKVFNKLMKCTPGEYREQAR